jgi:uncharacterized damage-inducible protein DinB
MRMKTKSRTEHLVAELHEEAALTRQVLERIPEDQLSWRPHPRSMSLGQLAMHVAGLPLGIAALLSEPTVDLPVVPLPEAATRGEILETLERSVTFASGRLAEWKDEGLDADWTLTDGENVLLVQPRGEVARTLMFNHWYHHRGQLTVYLRLLEVPLPPIYGPTADEKPSE